MKRLIYLSLAAMMVLAVSCNKNNKPDPAPKVPEEAVDLGIVMTREDGTTYNLYWAKSNLCEDGLCANPEDYGDYYAWGETKPYYEKGHSQDNPCSKWRVINQKTITGYDWASYKWCNGDYNKLTKYCTENDNWGGTGTPDKKTVLETGPDGDDVASKILGGKWRIPTNAEWEELRTKCISWTWTPQNGVNGELFTGPNGNSIFLPAAGYRDNTILDDVSSGGDYWSSSLDTDYQRGAWSACFDNYSACRGIGLRCYGRPIRPVWEE